MSHLIPHHLTYKQYHPSPRSLRVASLLGLRQSLLLGKDRVTNHHSKGDQRHRETDTCDAKQTLGVLVGQNNVVAIGCANGRSGCEFKGLRIDICGQGLVAKPVDKLTGQYLVPNRTRDGVSKSTANVVGGKEQTGDDGEV